MTMSRRALIIRYAPAAMAGVLSTCLASSCATRPALLPSPARETFRAAPPPVGGSPVLRLPRFEQATLGNGLTVLVCQRHNPALVDVRVAFAAGSGSEPLGDAGLAALTYGWLLQGAGEFDALGLDAAFAALGDTPSVRVDPDGAEIGVTVLSPYASAALALLAQVVLHPKLEDAGFARRQSAAARQPGGAEQ
jgi:zinc protease